MSLIADALRAAQTERGQSGTPGSTSRRAIAGTMLRSGSGRRGIGGPALRLPRPVGLAGAVLCIAILTALGVVAIAPDATRPRIGDTLRQANARSTTVPTATKNAGAPVRTAALTVAPRTLAAPLLATVPTRLPAGSAAMVRAAVSSAPARAEAETTGGSTGRFQISVAAPVVSASELLSDAVAAHRRGDVSGALSLYHRVLAAEPRNAAALRNLGAAHEALRQPALARDAFRRAIDLNARDAAAWSSLGAVLNTLGESQEAQAALGEAIRLDASNTGAKVNLANVYLSKGLAGDARRLLEDVVRVDPMHAEARYALGRLLEGQGERSAAVEQYRSFLEHGRGRFPEQEGLVRRRIEQLGGS